MSSYIPSGKMKEDHFQTKPELAFNESSSDIRSLIMSNAIYDKFDMRWEDRFSRFSIIDPYNALTNTKEYVFITKPDLCLYNPATQEITGSLKNRPFFVDALSRFKKSASQLQSSIHPDGNPFMTILSNSLTSSLDLPGISADTIDTAANVMGTKITYRGTSHKSDEEFDFNLEFEDTKYLDVYMLFKIYDEYEKVKWAGGIDFGESACGTSRWENYIINKVLHDQVSMYKFVVADDGYRIIYWAKLTGCIPTSIPRDAFSDMSNRESQKITVGWKSHFIRDMDPVIISHFNSLTKNISGFWTFQDLPLFNEETVSMEGRWAFAPYIESVSVEDNKHGNHIEYYLKWRG